MARTGLGLNGGCRGPYLAWLSTTAAQAEQVANQARAAAAAYETAFAAMVPPPVIAANRALLMSLIATNILGQNTPAITATEAHYGEMWAQDAAAMYSYAGSSAAAATLTPFTPPPRRPIQRRWRRRELRSRKPPAPPLQRTPRRHCRR